MRKLLILFAADRHTYSTEFANLADPDTVATSLPSKN